MVVNGSKTEICLFHKNDPPTVTVKLENDKITSLKSMNVLGVIFDSKLTWSSHVTHCINKAKQKLYGLRLLRSFFEPKDMRTLLDSYFYSTLYYNANVWLTTELNSQLKQSLLSISANALKSCMMYGNNLISFVDIHKNNAKCTPMQIAMYQSSLILYKALNSDELTHDIVSILTQMVCTSRQLKFEILRSFNTKIGLNTTANKLYPLNGKIGLDFLNLGFVQYKKIMKVQFLKYGKT